MYSMSNGLENFYRSGKVTTEDQLRALLKTYLINQIGPSDCVAFGNSYRYAKSGDILGIIEVDELISSMKLISEVRDATIRSGVQTLKCVASFKDDPVLTEYLKVVKDEKATGIYPVSIAVVSAAFDIPCQKAALIMIYSFTVSVIGAALRLGMLDHVSGQRIIDDFKPVMLAIIAENVYKPVTWMRQFAPYVDLNQIWHETSSNRMFIT
jgi:urease accessory protein